MAILTNYEGSNDDYENGGSAGKRAQGFQVQSNSYLTSVSIYGSRGSLYSGTTTITITQGTNPGGTVIGSKTINTSTLTAYGSPAWNEITFDNTFSLTASTQYYIEMNYTGSTNDEVRWSTDTTSPTYSYGTAWFYSASWTQVSTRDKNFRINGYEPASATNTTNFFSFI